MQSESRLWGKFLQIVGFDFQERLYFFLKDRHHHNGSNEHPEIFVLSHALLSLLRCWRVHPIFDSSPVLHQHVRRFCFPTSALVHPAGFLELRQIHQFIYYIISQYYSTILSYPTLSYPTLSHTISHTVVWHTIYLFSLLVVIRNCHKCKGHIPLSIRFKWCGIPTFLRSSWIWI